MDDGNKIKRQKPVISGRFNYYASSKTGDDFERKKSGSGSQETGASEADILHFTNQIRFAQAFIDVALQEYGAGNIAGGVKAHQAAQKAFSEAKRFLNELAQEHNLSLSRELKAIEHALANLASPP